MEPFRIEEMCDEKVKPLQERAAYDIKIGKTTRILEWVINDTLGMKRMLVNIPEHWANRLSDEQKKRICKDIVKIHEIIGSLKRKYICTMLRKRV